MRVLVLFALLSLAVAKPKPGGYYDPWQSSAYSSVGLVQQPTVTYAQPVLHAAPAVVAQPVPAVAVAKPATSYSSFQRVIHPVSVAQPVVHAAPVVQAVAQPVVHAAPVIQTVAQPVVQTVAQPVVQTVAQPVVHAAPVIQTVAQPVQKLVSLGSYESYGSYGGYGGFGGYDNHGW